MFEEALAITVYIPFDSQPDLSALDLPSLSAVCQTLPKVIDLLERSRPIGCLGHYAAAYELSIGLEGFTPLEGANPTQGEIGQRESVPTLCFKTYAPGGIAQEKVEAFLHALISIHPWEHPAIELHRAQLVRGPADAT
ncbi:hypothetical protein [Paraburkholderia sp. DHOC27]|uniref:hypothetical protein n=1 Tax=Paraburkholderia sp. DHOC27 TaxID=2303330 RepID=UPI000E3E77E7|nr:hypothetical protein [Paraburkholderia sp. DHOC27]RFU49165.1 hypothetical protein D0B32_04965 [Paraburkholderia sp. DHOC27]